MAIDPSKITAAVAEKIHSDLRGDEDQGETVIDGETVWWWADRGNVWFYASESDDGNETIKRFEVNHSFDEVNNNG